jgi:hypothetical protein
MSDPRVRRPAEKQLLITSAPGWFATLFGLPFLAAGLWFSYQFVAAIYTYCTTVARKDFPEALLAFAIILLVALIFGTPGVLLVLFRNRILIDAEARSVTACKDFLLFRRVTRYRLSEFSRVNVEYKEYGRETEDRQVTRTFEAWHIELCGKQTLLLGLWDKGEAAEAVANQVAALTGINVRRPRPGRNR